MSGLLSPESASASAAVAAGLIDPIEQDALRALNRSPHPYHHQRAERFVLRNGAAQASRQRNGRAVPYSSSRQPSFSKESSPASESGTEADDEHFLKGLPAPKVKPHKGLRGRSEPLSGTSTPLPSPAALDGESRKLVPALALSLRAPDRGREIDNSRRNKIMVRRATEAGIVVAMGYMVQSNRQVSPVLEVWGTDFRFLGLLYGGLLAIYPLRVVLWHMGDERLLKKMPLTLPSNFDPAPLLYPPSITLLVSLLVSANVPAVILPNIILSISSIPQQLVPKIDTLATYDSLHWALACLPLAWGSLPSIWGSPSLDPSRLIPVSSFVSEENIALLYPLYQIVSFILHDLTTTSLLSAELQLLTIALINVLLLASSPQVQILKALLWGGGLGILVLCGPAIRAGIALARVPKWRFRTVPDATNHVAWKNWPKFLTWKRIKSELLKSSFDDTSYDTPDSSEGEANSPTSKLPTRVRSFEPTLDSSPESVIKSNGFEFGGVNRRHTTSSYLDKPRRRRTTPSGRRKRATSISLRPFLKLTYGQAVMRKWCYALYVYACIFVVIAAAVRTYIQMYALEGSEPIGWGLGYAFGDLNWFRFRVVNANLERWICLPPRHGMDDKECTLGRVQHIRRDDFGEANTRLLITGCWVGIMIVGLMIVFRLKDIYEVDTRRKVFHFMMVGMFLPATFVDPTYAALCLSLMLAIFLMLDLLRASQLPPISKPIAAFLAPYVDGRDFRGPVVISHIFLLIGCAIPLWLALASLPRTGAGCLAGWEVPTRDLSMVSGVICVGLGDAAASLIGRRFGHRKWLWGGGKSLEGSAAFAVAVFAGLAGASAWLRVGGWPSTVKETSLLMSARNAGLCASMASLTEAVLTGGNDNVIVPVVLWTCVKSLDL